MTPEERASQAMIEGYQNCFWAHWAMTGERRGEECGCDQGAIDGCKARREAIAKAISPGWHPIETAPKDGKPFLAFGYYGYEALCWEGKAGVWQGADPDNPVRDITKGFYRWHTMPEPPEGFVPGQ